MHTIEIMAAGNSDIDEVCGKVMKALQLKTFISITAEIIAARSVLWSTLSVIQSRPVVG